MRGRDQPERLNRIVLSIVGLVLIALAAYGLLRSFGALGEDQAEAPVLTRGVKDFLDRNAEWFWPVVAAVALIRAYLADRWLKAQIRPVPTVRDVELARGPQGDYTRLRASGAVQALAADIEDDPGVRSANARLVSGRPDPELDVTVDLFEDADVSAVRRRVEQDVLRRFRGAIEADRLTTRILLRPAEPARRSVE